MDVNTCGAVHPQYLGVFCTLTKHPGSFEHKQENSRDDELAEVTWHTRPDERVGLSAPTTVLEEAQRHIYGDRQEDYGPPTESFESIAGLWTAYLEAIKFKAVTVDGEGQTLSAVDVAHLMILMKVSRNTTGGYKRDNAVDIAGYAGCLERIEEGK